jgi:hypothetical protein
MYDGIAHQRAPFAGFTAAVNTGADGFALYVNDKLAENCFRVYVPLVGSLSALTSNEPPLKLFRAQ